MICVTDHSTRHGRFKPPSFESLWDSSDRGWTSPQPHSLTVVPHHPARGDQPWRPDTMQTDTTPTPTPGTRGSTLKRLHKEYRTSYPAHGGSTSPRQPLDRDRTPACAGIDRPRRGLHHAPQPPRRCGDRPARQGVGLKRLPRPRGDPPLSGKVCQHYPARAGIDLSTDGPGRGNHPSPRTRGGCPLRPSGRGPADIATPHAQGIDRRQLDADRSTQPRTSGNGPEPCGG